MKEYYKGKKILITGAAGTVGKEIVKQVYSFNPSELRLMDNNETGMFFLMEAYGNDKVFSFLGDIRDRDKLEKLSKKYGFNLNFEGRCQPGWRWS